MNAGTNTPIENIINALKSLRVGVISQEYDLQADIATSLSKAGICFEKEHVLGRGNRVDFLANGGVAIEVKKGKPNRARLMAQIERYAAFNIVQGIVIVVETGLRMPPGRTVNGKPCAILGLQKLWGIAL